MDSRRSLEQRHVLEQASVKGGEWLKHILDVEQHSNEELARSLTDSPLKPFWVANAQAILFYSFTKTSALLGRAKGEGYLVSRLPTTHPTLIKFSAPLFLDISFTSFGLAMGRCQTYSFVACMGKQMQEQLLRSGRRRLRGMDATLVCGSTLQERSDFLTSNCAGGAAMDTVGVSTVKGSMFELSFAGGSLRVDTAKNISVYGADVKPSQILDGTVAPPPEMQPLYTELSLIVHQEQADRPSAAPSRTSASLERYSTGQDPDKVLVLNDGSLWKDERPKGAPLQRHSI